jgi:hypothetical protein
MFYQSAGLLSSRVDLLKKKFGKNRNFECAPGERILLKMRELCCGEAVSRAERLDSRFEAPCSNAARAQFQPLSRRKRQFTGWLSKFFMTSGLMLALVSCQSEVDSLGGVKAKNDLRPPPSTSVTEAFGDKGAEITLMLAKAPVGYVMGDTRDVRDGAALAIGELGEDMVRARVADVSSGAAAGIKEVEAAKARGSVVLVSYAPGDVTTAIATVPADQRPLLINVGRRVNVSGGVFNLASDEVDSAIAGVRTAATSGKRKFVIFVPSDYPAGYEAGIQAAINAAGGAVIASPRYVATGTGVSEAALSAQPALKSADAALVLGNTSAVAGLVSAMKASGTPPTFAFIGTSGWPEEALSVAGASGVMIVSVDRENRALIAERYNRRYGRPLSAAAAYGYDAVALASGIVRAKGPAGLTQELLTRKAGFTGITGLFRLTASGQVERKLTPYIVSNGKLERMTELAAVKN